MDSRAKLEESRRLLEKLKFEREQRTNKRLNQQKTTSIVEVNNVDINEEVNVQISTCPIPESIREKPKVVYYTKSTNTNDLEALIAIQTESAEEMVDLAKLRKNIEVEIKSKLDSEYQKLYKDIIQNNENNNRENMKVVEAFQPEKFHKSVIQNLTKLIHPVDPPSYISKPLHNKLVTVHGEYLICVWNIDPELKLINSIKSTTSISVTEFRDTTNDIITGSRLGTLHLYTFEAQFNAYILFAESSQSLQEPIIGIKSTSETFILITQNAKIAIVASNLNDILKPLQLLKKNTILSQTEFIDLSRVVLGDIKGNVYIVDIGTFEMSSIYTSTEILPVISLAYRSTLISGLIAISNLHTTIHIVDVNSKETIEIPMNSFAIDIGWLDHNLVTTYLSGNASCTYDIWSIDDNQMSSKHLKKVESELVSTIIPMNNKILAFNPKGSSIIVHL